MRVAYQHLNIMIKLIFWSEEVDLDSSIFLFQFFWLILEFFEYFHQSPTYFRLLYNGIKHFVSWDRKLNEEGKTVTICGLGAEVEASRWGHASKATDCDAQALCIGKDRRRQSMWGHTAQVTCSWQKKRENLPVGRDVND